MPFYIVRNDITKLENRVDAIVNTANPRPIVGSGTDFAIHKAAGPELLAAREKIGDIARGQSAITPAFHLNAKYVIHSVGPHWLDGNNGELETLRSAYDTALQLALENKCESIAFPLMAAGSYGFPKDKALSVANQAIGDFLFQHEMDVYLVVFNSDAFQLSKQLQDDIQSFIDEYYVETAKREEYQAPRSIRERRLWEQERRLYPDNHQPEESRCFESVAAPVAHQKRFADLFKEYPDLDTLLKQKTESFSEAVIRIIDEHGWKDSEVYGRVHMERQQFHKIISDKNYHPIKGTALLMAIALHLNMDQTRDLIAKAGYGLSESNLSDIIVAYFISNERYNSIEEIEEVLDNHHLPLFNKMK